jgi:hypothetical protein
MICSAVDMICSAVDTICSAVGTICSAVDMICSAVDMTYNTKSCRGIVCVRRITICRPVEYLSENEKWIQVLK